MPAVIKISFISPVRRGPPNGNDFHRGGNERVLPYSLSLEINFSERMRGIYTPSDGIHSRPPGETARFPCTRTHGKSVARETIIIPGRSAALLSKNGTSVPGNQIPGSHRATRPAEDAHT